MQDPETPCPTSHTDPCVAQGLGRGQTGGHPRPSRFLEEGRGQEGESEMPYGAGLTLTCWL